MDSAIILHVSRDTLAGTISFPQVVERLLAAGVEYYHVDYAALRKTFYGADGSAVVTAIDYEGLPPISPGFSPEALCASILDSQRHGQA
ncbi:MAG TPA: hypothetical protein VGO59_05420 [Verrucomicrobiae bacterium]